MGYVSKIFVTVDVIILKKTAEYDKILLIKRKNEPFKNFWALPGGFVDENEDLEDAAKRELKEETSLTVEKLSQIGAYGKPYRDPRSHIVTIAYCGRVEEIVEGKAADDAKELKWFAVNNLPPLAFDHLQIITDALNKVK